MRDFRGVAAWHNKNVNATQPPDLESLMAKTPFFLRFVETTPTAELRTDVKAGAESRTNWWSDKQYEPTLKYPSDDDEIRY